MPSLVGSEMCIRDSLIPTNVRGPPDKYGLLTLGRPSVRCYSTLRAWYPVCGSTVRVSHVCNCLSPLGFAVLKNNLSLLEGLEFTPAASATTKGDIHVPGTYTKIFVFIFRLMTYTDVCFFSLSGVLFPRE